MNKDIERILYDEAELAFMVDKIAEQINRDYAGTELVVVGILKGSFMFLADLFRKITVENCTIDFMTASSYGSGTESIGTLRVTKDISCDIKDKNVIIVEDILDTGNTLSYIKSYLLNRGALSVKVCTLFDKPSRRRMPITPDYCGHTIGNSFIVGYGLDYDERYRNLPYVGVIKENKG